MAKDNKTMANINKLYQMLMSHNHVKCNSSFIWPKNVCIRCVYQLTESVVWLGFVLGKSVMSRNWKIHSICWGRT